jgi:ubiquinone/menaquinone biosynthesis C-methylase UbiE
MTWSLFDRVAGEYDQVAPFFACYGAEIVRLIDPPAGCRFLDLGAGRGALTGPALARGCVVTAVDAAPAMVERLRADFPAATAYVMDAQALALAPAGFDVVVSSFVIHVLDDPAAGVAEAFRVLAPGGRFVMTSGGKMPAGLSARLDALFLEFSAYLPSGGGMGRPLDAAEMLAGAGFAGLREEFASVAIPFADNEMLWRWALSHGYRAFIEDLPGARREEFRERVLALPSDDRVLRRTTGLWSGIKP